jgi:DNA-directed RNA polymerase specialized sigma24 family protein
LNQLLRNDWQQYLHSARLRDRFADWQSREPTLARFPYPVSLVRFMRTRGFPAEKDAVLAALLRWAKEDCAAAQVVVEVLRPGFLNLCSRLVRESREREELQAILLLALWEGIRRYPLTRRPRRIAANLLLDAMHRALGELGRESEWSASRALRGIEDRQEHRAEDDGDVDGLLDAAVRAGAVSPEESELILASRIDGAELSELARSAGLSYNTMKLRRQRAERRLLVFLGHRPVPRGRQNRPSSLARVAGVGSQDPAG